MYKRVTIVQACMGEPQLSLGKALLLTGKMEKSLLTVIQSAMAD